jgi:leucyl-tRNA synthetase
MGYGTGAVMGVPSHDERDFDFAKMYKIPVIAVYEPNLDAHPELVKDQDPQAVREKVLAGEMCWPGEGICIHGANEEFSINGLDASKAKPAMIAWLEKKGYGQTSVHYKLRDWLFSRQRYWGEPFPILHFEDGSKRTLDLDELPLCPPEVTNYKPTGDGLSPLAQVKEWVEIVDTKAGKKALRETNTMPQWAGSCWYYLRFCDPHNEREAWGKEAEQYWLPVDLYVGGVEHAVLHLLYSRFWHKVLHDCGFVSTPEPFQTLRNQGMILSRSYQNQLGAYVDPSEVQEKEGAYVSKKTGEKLRSQVEKMSKSKLNGVTPDDIIEEFGADSLRLYEMFMGPLEKEKIWNTDAVSGCRRFLSRVYEIVHSDKLTDEDSFEATKLGHRLVHGVSSDIEALQFNTAIAKMMEFINDFTRLESYPRSVVMKLAQVLMPFAPHLAEEVWEILGCTESLSYTPLPKVDEKYLEDEVVTYVVQVNGKLRGRFDLPKNQTQEAILEAAKKHPAISKYLENVSLVKAIYVPNKLLNLVVK